MRSLSHIFMYAAGAGLFTVVGCSAPSGDRDDAGAALTGAGGASGAGGATSADGRAASPDATRADAGRDATPEAAVAGAGSDRCATATAIPLSPGDRRADLLATTVGATHDIDVPCVAGAGADIFYKFAFSKRVFVYADTFGASWDTVLFLLSDDCAPLSISTTPDDAVCNDVACGTTQSQIVALLEPGFYRLGLSGRGGAQGPATIHFEWALAGSGTVAPLPQGTNVLQGTTAGTGAISGLSPECLAAGPENSYWWARCPSDPGGPFTASTCGGTTWESALELQLARSPVPYACNVDGCGLQASFSATIPAGAGLGVLSVDGEGGTAFGAYTVNVTRP